MAKAELLTIDIDTNVFENTSVLGIEAPHTPLHRMAHFLNKSLCWDFIRQEEDYRPGCGVLLHRSEADHIFIFLLANNAENSLVTDLRSDFFLLFCGEIDTYDLSTVLKTIEGLDFIFNTEVIDAQNNKDLSRFLENYTTSYEIY